MAGILPTSSSSTLASDKAKTSTDAINDIDLNTFLKLMIAELQNQDPLNPLDNKDMLAQISQIREVGATDKLTQTLDSVLLGQNISSATNLIGADISALSDDGQSITGIVDRVSIDKGSPKLHVENMSVITRSDEDGDIAAGTYGYRVVWQDEAGNLIGLDSSGDEAIQTSGIDGVDTALKLVNLPKTTGSKQVYRTDSSGQEPYQLVGTIVDGDQGTFVDKLSDADRSSTRLTQPFSRAQTAARSYEVSLNNISAIRPPS
jgi:flagellar hook assembly protein FlgD